METIPLYIPVIFFLTVVLSFFILAKAVRFSRPLMVVSVLWLLLQALLGRSGFYTVSGGVPPRFLFLLLPPLLFVAGFMFSKKGRAISGTWDTGMLTLFHIVRIPVELVLYLLLLQHVVPAVMTFEGRNFDILCGLTAPFVYYFGFRRKRLSKTFLIAWNLACLLLLANIVVTAVLSAPFRFQQFGFDQPNIALFYFPFVWLPCFVIPVALFAHLVSLRELFSRRGEGKQALVVNG